MMKITSPDINMIDAEERQNLNLQPMGSSELLE